MSRNATVSVFARTSCAREEWAAIPQVFRTPSQRVSKAQWRKLAKSSLQFLSASFYVPEPYCKCDRFARTLRRLFLVFCDQRGICINSFICISENLNLVAGSFG